MYLEDDSPWGVKRIYHGIAFQELLIVISLMHEMDITSLMSKMGKECSFSIDTELESAQGFDDIVVWHEQNKDIVHKFIQVKHNQNGTKKISVSSLLTKSGKFSILKLFLAYLKIKNSAKFSDGIKHFLFATNMDLDSPYSIQHEVRNLRAMLSGENKGKELSFVRIDTKDEFLDIGDSARYRISDSGGSVAQYLKQNMDFIKREIGKEVSNKEIEDFLNELVFVVNLPHEAQLRKLLLGKLSSRLNKKFDYIGDNQIFCNNLLKKISDWVKDIKARPLSYKEGEELFREVELWASTLGKIEQGVKENNERIDKVIEQQHKDSKTLHKIYVAVTTQDNKRVEEPIWFKIIEPVAFFTGRNSELKALHDALQRSTVRPAIISQVATISGLGGIGKSEFARQYAYTYGKDYYANVIWINAESVETMKNSFLGLVKDDRLGISTKDRYERDKTIENIVREIYAFFARRKGKSLFIFDNAEGYENIKRFLPSSLHPRHKKPYILITSRDCKWNVRGESDIKVIQLDKFGEVEALEFVRKALNIENNLQDREIEELTRELQYFPLALGQAVVYIQDRNEESRLRGDKRFKISDYLKEYQQNAGELLKKGIYENEDRYTKTVLTTWNVTMTYICKEYGFEALNIFEIVAYLAPDDIRIKEIFSKSIADDKEKLWNAVELLNRYSMIKLREGIVNIHSPVQKVTRLKLQEKGREEEVLRKALNLVNIGDVAKDNKIHVAFIWGYASKHGKLIDDFYKDTNLHLLVENGDYKAIKNLLAYIKRKHQNKLSGIVNAKNGCDIAPLHLAAGNGELDIAKYLINEGANIDARDCFYQTPLYWAAKSGELDMVKYLVNKGASVGIKDNYGWTVLYWAVESESFDIAEYLIKEKGMGIDVSAKYSNGKTMLHEAIRFAKLDAIKYLIDKGIDINIKNGYGDTPLHWAAIREKVDVVRYFVEQGAHVNAKNNEGKTALDYVTDNQELVELLLTHDESVEVA